MYNLIEALQIVEKMFPTNDILSIAWEDGSHNGVLVSVKIDRVIQKMYIYLPNRTIKYLG